MTAAPGASAGDVTVRDAVDADVERITEIYNQYLHTRAIEWTERPHTVEGRQVWLDAKRREGWPVLVAEVELRGADGVRRDVVGLATYGDFRDSTAREGYRFTVEHSVHVLDAAQGIGVGRRLMEELIDRARTEGKHVMVAAIDGENPDSVAFHQRLGFVEVGRMPEVGRKFDRWLTLVLMQRVL